MGGSYGFFEIILFAGIAVFLVFRLRSVLGKRSGQERSTRDEINRNASEDSDNVVSLADSNATENGESGAGQELAEGSITQIKAVDPSFDERSFLRGARTAFEMAVKAFAAGDGKTLRTLLSDEVYENFAKEIRAREISNHIQETTLVRIISVDIMEASIRGGEAFLTTCYVSEQINTTFDGAGEIVEGNSELVVEVTDIWTFARDMRASDPNWTLVATRSPD